MELRTRALISSVGIVLSSAGCIALARETYTSLRGPDAVAIQPGDSFEVSTGRTGHAISQSTALARSGAIPGASITAAICDWDAGVWFIVFPPLPIPLLSLDESPGRPGTTVVRLKLEGEGTWRARFSELVLVGADGVRAVPERYQLVTKQVDDSPEPCALVVEPRTAVAGAELAVFGRAELWLRFATLDWPETPRVLELGGLTLDGTPLPTARLDFAPGARWFWYRVFP